jgi:hypothetical protein
MRTTITAQLAEYAVVGLSAGTGQHLAPASSHDGLGTAPNHTCHDARATVPPGTSRAAVAATSQPPRGSRS